MKSISKNQVLDRIKFENPWWRDGNIASDFASMKRRLYFSLFHRLVAQQEVRRAVVLMGPRRIGKTVLLYHSIQNLIESGVDPRKIVFITVENPIYNGIDLDTLCKYGKEAAGREGEEGWYIFLDEIQYYMQWPVELKILVDSYRLDRFVVSGSAAAALRAGSLESGAGRFTDFMLPPLTFHEYVHLTGNESMMITKTHGEREYVTTSDIDLLNKHFIDYVNYGGFPEVTLSNSIKKDMQRFMRQDVVDKVLLRDLPSLYGVSNTVELNSFFTTLAYNTGEELSIQALHVKSGISKTTINKYLEYLEAAYLIQRVQRVDQNAKRFTRNNVFKVYLTNPSLRSALFTPLESHDEQFPHLVETAIFAQRLHRAEFPPYYARWNKGRGNDGEVDMVGLSRSTLKPEWAVEIKWSDRYYSKPSGLKSLLKFCQDKDIKSPVVTSISKTGTIEHNGQKLYFIPCAVYAYNSGRRTIIENSGWDSIT